RKRLGEVSVLGELCKFREIEKREEKRIGGWWYPRRREREGNEKTAAMIDGTKINEMAMVGSERGSQRRRKSRRRLLRGSNCKRRRSKILGGGGRRSPAVTAVAGIRGCRRWA
ncbi:hypothetical protein LINPERHAP1_LOCUS19115, partial [Linum perenne]